jgi:BirA family biotin operon repressor/biotin-[acetyl-CoA-carboxylase] ligase
VSPSEALSNVANPWASAEIHVVERTQSTMDDAYLLAVAGCPTGTVAAAGFQERGRGRVPGRQWVSAAWESLLATVVVRLSETSAALHELPLRAGVAAALAVEDATGLRIDIKWPNDLLLAGKKLGGILCEARGAIGLIGFGLNCAQRSFEGELAESAGSILQARGRAIAPSDMLAALLPRLKDTLADDHWRAKLRERLHGRGRAARVALLGSDDQVAGIILDVDELGRLALELPGGEIRFVSQGEIRTGR